MRLRQVTGRPGSQDTESHYFFPLGVRGRSASAEASATLGLGDSSQLMREEALRLPVARVTFVHPQMLCFL
jgi:hypothetical protein